MDTTKTLTLPVDRRVRSNAIVKVDRRKPAPEPVRPVTLRCISCGARPAVGETCCEH